MYRLLLGILLLLGFGCSQSEAPSPPPVTASTLKAQEPDTSGTTEKTKGQTLYTCGMHPQIVQDEPGRCPIDGMELVPIQRGGTNKGIVEIDPAIVQTIGVRTATVEVRPLSRIIRSSGYFRVPEPAEYTLTPKISGWVEKLYVDEVGERVQKGTPVLEIYSPELVSAQEEFLLALRQYDTARKLANPQLMKDTHRLVEAARTRLAYWDFTEAQIERLKQSRQPRKTVVLYAPTTGIVLEKYVIEGQEVRPGQPLLHLANLRTLWLDVALYEQDLPWLSLGQPVRVEVTYFPGKTFTGSVEFIYDTLDPQTRTVRARLSIANPDLLLKPGMYAIAYVEGRPLPPSPVVPEDALILTGERQLVILALGHGKFLPKEITLGVFADGYAQVLEGLQGGERIVTSAQFLIDSESRLKSALGLMAGHQHGSMTDMEMSEETPEESSNPDHQNH